MGENKLMKKKKAELVNMILSKDEEIAMIKNHNDQLLNQLDCWKEALEISDIKIEQLRKDVVYWRNTWQYSVVAVIVYLLVKCAI